MLAVIHLTKHKPTWSIRAPLTPICKPIMFYMQVEIRKKPTFGQEKLMNLMVCITTTSLVCVKHMTQLCCLAFICHWVHFHRIALHNRLLFWVQSNGAEAMLSLPVRCS